MGIKGLFKLKRTMLFVVVMLVVQFALYSGAIWASAGSSPDGAVEIGVGSTDSDSFGTGTEERWYKVTPSSNNVQQATHLLIETHGNLDTVLEVFEDLESARNGVTYHEGDDEGVDYNAIVAMPLAWKGTYYIKVTQYEYDQNPGNYQISVATSTLPPLEANSTAIEKTTNNTSALEKFITADDVKKDKEVSPKTEPAKNSKQEYVANEIIVKIKPGIKQNMDLQAGTYSNSVNKKLKSYGSDLKYSKLKNDSTDSTFIVKYNSKKPIDVLAVSKELAKLSDIEYAEPNYILYSSSNDIYYNYQWSLKNTENPGKDINFEGMYNALQGQQLPTTMIAVIDTGVNYKLADLSGITRTDIDYDYVNSDSDAMDDNEHGTHVSGIIAASGNNYYSMIGINKYCSILPLKVLDSGGRGTDSDVAAAIRYAADKGAKVINLSLGFNGFSYTIEDALSYAASKNVLIVAASGNDSAGQISYPAVSDYALSVGATNKYDQLSWFSNYGEGLDVVAPGEDIPSLVHVGHVVNLSGTSMATPHVSALAGIIYSKMPGVSRQKAEELIKSGCTDLGSAGVDNEYGWGRIDAYKTLLAIDALAPNITSLTANKPSPQPVGTTIRWSAGITGGQQPVYLFRVYKGTTIVVPGSWSSSNYYDWTPTSAGSDYWVKLYVKENGTDTSTAKIKQSGYYNITAPASSITITSLTANKPSPQAAGTTIRWSAGVSGAQQPLYLFRVYKGSAIVVSGSWSSANYYDWTPASAGTDYWVKLYVKENGTDSSTAKVKQSGNYTITAPITPITITSLTANKPSPQAAGTTIRWSAGISGGQRPVYLFRVYKGSTIVVSGSWSSANYYDWTPASAGSDYWVKLYVKENGADSGTAKIKQSGNYTITAPVSPITITSLTANKPSPQAAGTTIRWSAGISGGQRPVYLFRVYKGSTVVVSGSWSSANYYDWTPASAGSDYWVKLYVKENGADSGTAKIKQSGYYTITAPIAPITITSLTADKPSPQAAGTPIRWSAGISGGQNPVYLFRVYKGSSVVISGNWSSANYYDWTPDSAGSDYWVKVYVKENGTDSGTAKIKQSGYFTIQ